MFWRLRICDCEKLRTRKNRPSVCHAWLMYCGRSSECGKVMRGKPDVASMASGVGHCTSRKSPPWLTYTASGNIAVWLKTNMTVSNGFWCQRDWRKSTSVLCLRILVVMKKWSQAAGWFLVSLSVLTQLGDGNGIWPVKSLWRLFAKDLSWNKCMMKTSSFCQIRLRLKTFIEVEVNHMSTNAMRFHWFSGS